MLPFRDALECTQDNALELREAPQMEGSANISERLARKLPRPIAAEQVEADRSSAASDISPSLGNQALQQVAAELGARAAVLSGGVHGLGNAAIQRLAIATKEEGRPTPDLGRQIKNAAGSGQPLAAPLQRSLESGLGADLSGVRVHADSEADRLAQAVNAEAFTTGSDIFFRSGNYQPDAPEGIRMLAHEATHVVQQRSGPVAGTPVAGGVAISSPGDPYERAAVHQADRLVGSTADGAKPTSASAPASPSPIQRAGPEDEELLQGYVQRAGPEEELLQGYVQRAGPEEELLQG
ncbi:MAG: DUF4157 domain-containing protein [Dehalococcoidia bacterium]|nr:DUF4157 domain-containing protein [Dehalococcoidia bacterium]